MVIVTKIWNFFTQQVKFKFLIMGELNTIFIQSYGPKMLQLIIDLKMLNNLRPFFLRNLVNGFQK